MKYAAVSHLTPQGPIDTDPDSRHILKRVLGRSVVVLDRAQTFYAEEEVALRRRRDIRDYIDANHDQLCPFPAWRAVFVAITEKHRTRLRIWFYDPQLLASLVGHRPCLLLPQELLIAASEDGEQLYRIVGESGQGLWVHARQRRLVEARFDPPVALDGEQTLEDARELLGLSPLVLSPEQARQRAVQGIAHLPWGTLGQLLHWPRASALLPEPSQLRRYATLALAGVVLWLLAGSSWLYYQQQQLEARRDQLAEPVQRVMQTAAQERELVAEVGSLSEPIMGYYSVSQIMNRLSQINFEDITLSRLEFAQGELTLNGEADDASAFLGRFSGRDWVADAAFTSPVSRRDGRDRFRLSITLVPAEVLNEQ